MHFASNTSLTPLGVRLLNVSHAKLEALDAPSRREPAHALHRAVLVREAVRSAWASVNDHTSELTDWRSTNALGLDAVTEEDEEDYDQDVAEERWLDDVLANVEQAEEPYWVEATVGTPDYEEDQYEYAEVESYTFPTQTTSLGTDVTVVSVADMEEDDEYVDSWFELDDKYNYASVEEEALELSPSSSSSASTSSIMEPVTPPAVARLPLARRRHVEILDCEAAEIDAKFTNASDVVVMPKEHMFNAIDDDMAFMYYDSAYNDYNDCADGECELDFIQSPPPLEHDTLDDDDDCECRTPPLVGSEELEAKTGGKGYGWNHREFDEDWASVLGMRIAGEVGGE